MNLMDNCIFCKIVNKTIPAHIIYEDEVVVALLDIAQSTPGHSLIILKAHSDNITKANENDLAHAMKVVKRIVSKQLEVLPNIIGVNVINNVLAGSGQSVMHTHIHMVPRFNGDAFNIKWVNNIGSVTATIMEELKAKLKL
jgi:histidine triad (HIT) family protein